MARADSKYPASRTIYSQDGTPRSRLGQVINRRQSSPTGASQDHYFAAPGFFSPQDQPGARVKPILGSMDRWRQIDIIYDTINTVSASVADFISLVESAEWTVSPAEGTNINETAAQDVADFITKALFEDCRSPFTQRNGDLAMARMKGFSLLEWWMRRDENGMLTLADMQPRPQNTISEFVVDSRTNQVTGIWQDIGRGRVLLNREDCVYQVRNVRTTSNWGEGLLFELAPNALDLIELLRNRAIGYRNLFDSLLLLESPDGYKEMVDRDPNLTQNQKESRKAEYDQMVQGLMHDLSTYNRNRTVTALNLPSTPYMAKTGKSSTTPERPVFSTTQQWNLRFVTPENTHFDQLDATIHSMNLEIARILGTEGRFLGDASNSANRALGQEKNDEFLSKINSQNAQNRDVFQADLVDQLCFYNGIPQDLWPSLEVETVRPSQLANKIEFAKTLVSAGLASMLDPFWNSLREDLGEKALTEEEIADILADIGAGASMQEAEDALDQPSQGEEPTEDTPEEEADNGN